MKYLLPAVLTLLLCLFVSCSSETEVAPDYDPTVRIDMEEISQLYPSVTDIPVIYIDLDRDLWHVDKEEYAPATVTAPESGIVEAEARLKGRGNASWNLPQKPYNIKFHSDTDFFGMGEAKSWVLITLFYDKTLLRNYLTLNLAETISSGSEMDCRFVDVVINGEYNGLYLLTEKIEDDKNRVDLSKKDGDTLFEIEQAFRHNDICDNCIPLKSGAHLTFKDPEPEDLTAEEFIDRKNAMTEFLSAADAAIKSKDYEQFSAYIDVESFINWYIVNEFVKNYDSQFVTSCYCYVKEGKLFMGPCWDYDTCMGNQDVATCMDPKGFHVRIAPWFVSLLKSDEFCSLLYSRWNELVSDGVFDNMLLSIDEQTEYLSQASAVQFERWPDSLRSTDLRGRKALFTYEEELEYLKNWISQRVEFLNSKWTIE